ncbi:hypothetical protein [Psychrobacter ciconiae]|uniref:hypothetical protein n=1 Tax=Psychrobacter ciconiae TaxID=1553449 RepID=UPI0019194B31|nr:hypothetical protein [Psychrobacter ciconiae]
MYADLTYGTFSTNLTPEYRFGLPFAVKMGGVVMDIDKIAHTTVERNNDKDKLSAYNLSRGPSYSLNENLVPEQLFDDPDTPEKEADGISAVKALTLAAQQGQTIYTITKANYAEVLPKLNHSDVVMTDIRNGVNAGRTVTVHDTQMSFNGWKGTGYTILDPVSGAGAYMIGGGLDGGVLKFVEDNAFIISLVLLGLSFVPYVGQIANILGWALGNYLLYLSFHKSLNLACARNIPSVITVYGLIFALNTGLSFLGGGAIGAIIAYFLGDTLAESIAEAANNIGCREMP